MKRPLLTLASAFAVGAALPPPPLRPDAAAWAAPLPLLLTALGPALAPIGFGAAGWLAAAAERAPPTAAPGPEPVRLEGRVASVPERLEDRVRFTLRAADGALLSAVAPDLPWPLALGDRIALGARLRAPEGVRNPGGRDRAAALRARGIALEAQATGAPVRRAPPSPLAALEQARRRFAAAAGRSLPAREAALVRAIGAGDRAGVDQATADAFARSGLAHLLSVSGLHLAVVALGAYRALRAALARCEALARRLDPRRAAAAAALPLTALYALATGADVPVLRSAVAAALGLGGVLLAREVDALDALGAAALALVAADPGALRDPSLQLSFASVAGLALWAGPLRRALPVAADRATRRGRAREALLAAGCASVAATLATAPIVAFHFRRLSLMGALANLPGVPLGAALTVAAAAAALGGALAPPLAAALFLPCRPLAWALLELADRCAAPAWAAPALGSPGPWGVALAYAALAGAWRARGAWRALLAVAAAAALLLPAPARRALAVRRGGLEVLFLDVGQGDAAAFLLPDGSAVLVDGGGEARGRRDPGARDVVPFLRDAGVRRVAALFVSHPHPDHLLGLVAVAEAFPVAHLFGSGRRGGDDVAEAWRRLPPLTALPPGAAFEQAGVRFEALAPGPGAADLSENDASLVLRVTHGRVRFLLLGDVEAAGEAALLAGAAPEALRAEVVKVPHHGSATSSGPDLVAAARPAHAVVTVGLANRFGFPAPPVLARWAAGGALVHRTDGGAVRFLSDGQAVRAAPAASAVDALALLRERF